MNNLIRKKTREVDLNGKIKMGKNNPVIIQSMTNTPTADIEATIKQTRALFDAGCEAVRITVNTQEAANALPKIRETFPDKPLIADIHFDYKMALAAIDAGFDKIRINPGNIGSEEKVKAVIDAAKEKNVTIRIGVNGGSLDPLIEKKYGRTPKASVESIMEYVRMLEKWDFHNIVLSIKWSDVPRMVEANKLLSETTDYPIHIGLTEAGTVYAGSIASGVGIGALLMQGIGDTIRVSLTGDPVKEIRAAKIILQSTGLRDFGPKITSCPTCGRTEIDMIPMAEKVEERLMREYPDLKIHVAVMGCVVNGPGEAKEADIGIAGGKGVGIIFKKGELIGKYPEDELIDALFNEIEKIKQEKV